MKTFTNEMKENDDVESLFLVKDKAVSLTKGGNTYIRLRLGDRYGEMEGRIWNSVETLAEAFQKNDFVQVKGKVVSYQDHLQLNISQIEKMEDETVSLPDFFPMVEKNIDEMMDSLIEITRRVKDPHLNHLVQRFWEDQAFLERFRMAPASKQLHHAYLGGLLEHTLSVAQLVLTNASHFKGLNADLLLVGAILHDLGKVCELSYRRSFDYSDEGRLLGHIVLGVEMVEEKVREDPHFPKDLSMLLKHLLVSHHGQYLWGSPKKPMILEAIMLHALDDLDAKMNGIQHFLNTKVPEGSRWSSYHPLLEQFFYLPASEDMAQSIENIDEIGFIDKK